MGCAHRPSALDFVHSLEMKFLISMHSSALSVRAYVTPNLIERKGLTCFQPYPAGTSSGNFTTGAIRPFE